MMEIINVDIVKDKIKKILYKVFPSDYQKQQIIDNNNELRFACPICFDSTSNKNAKRGNMYLNSGFFHCYNCSAHKSIIKLFDSFKEDLDLKDKIIIQKIINSQAKKKFNDYNLDFDRLNEIGIDKDFLFNKLKLSKYEKDDTLINKRLIKHRINNLGYDYKGNTYIFNLINNKVIGYQIRMEWNGKKYYDKYPLSRIYSKVIKDDLPEEDHKYDKISLIYNFFDIDFNKPITIFEGAFDSWFCNNSIGQSSVTIKMDLFDNINNTRYFYDNDKIGKQKMSIKLKTGKYVFQWNKFIKELNIKDKHVKDLNDVAIYFKKEKRLKDILLIDKYFTNNKMDLIYV